MKDLLDYNRLLPDTLHEALTNTPLSGANLAVLYDHVNHAIQEKSERLAFLLVLLSPDMPFDRMTREKWLAIMREAHRQQVLIVSYGVCEFLLPIDRNVLQEFRTGFLPTLTAFESDAFDFNLDQTRLIQLQNASERKMNALLNELASLVGDMNVDAQVLKARVEEMRRRLQRRIGGPTGQ